MNGKRVNIRSVTNTWMHVHALPTGIEPQTKKKIITEIPTSKIFLPWDLECCPGKTYKELRSKHEGKANESITRTVGNNCVRQKKKKNRKMFRRGTEFC